MSAADDAITQATRLSQVGFAEFTSKLITDIFAALLDANLKQIAAYTDLIQTTSATLSDFITRNTDSISQQDKTIFIKAIGGVPEIIKDTTLDATMVARINAAIHLPDNALPDNANVDKNNEVATAGKLTEDTAKAIGDAVARRIAANRYDLLCTMVRQGMLRLVVDNGIIETRLTFQTNGYIENNQGQSITTNTGSSGSGGGVGFGGGIGSSTFDNWLSDVSGVRTSMLGGGIGVGGGGGQMSNVTISTASSSERDVNGSSVQIYGRVEVRFKTDYVPLSS